VDDSIEHARRVLRRDLDPDFIETFANQLAWEYDDLFRRVSALEGTDWGYREEALSRGRADCAVRALIRAAKQHGVPHELRRLECNGQHKLLVKAGRVILIQEPTVGLDAAPSAADYKIELARMHGFVRQLELDLGDQPNRILDWSGCVLGVVLHGHADRHKRGLGTIMLAVPDAEYSHWVLRLDLEAIAMFGRNADEEDAAPSNPAQEDNVIVLPKKRRTQEDIA
jgi:hypothetical protein